MQLLIVLFASAVLAVAPSSTQPAAPAPTTRPIDPVDSLVFDLAADDWPTRQRAEDTLVEQGRPVVDRLKHAVTDGSLPEEVRQRASSALARIAERESFGASSITLHMKDAHLRDVFAEISRQCGAELLPMPAELWDLRPWP